MLTAFLISLSVSLVATYVLIKYQHIHAHLSTDGVASGPQKMHSTATPRIGGIPVIFGLFAGMLYLQYNNQHMNSIAFAISLMPVWIAGIIEDLTKKVSALQRLIAAFISALVGMYLLHTRIYAVGIPFFDAMTQGSLLVNSAVMMVGVGGATHSLNLIDGFNGLASGITMMLLAVVAVVSLQVGDSFIFSLSLLLIAATLGFFLFNFPKGKIFAGDGGAYLWGFAIAELLVMLVQRNPAVSMVTYFGLYLSCLGNCIFNLP